MNTHISTITVPAKEQTRAEAVRALLRSIEVYNALPRYSRKDTLLRYVLNNDNTIDYISYQHQLIDTIKGVTHERVK